MLILSLDHLFILTPFIYLLQTYGPTQCNLIVGPMMHACSK